MCLSLWASFQWTILSFSSGNISWLEHSKHERMCNWANIGVPLGPSGSTVWKLLIKQSVKKNSVNKSVNKTRQLDIARREKKFEIITDTMLEWNFTQIQIIYGNEGDFNHVRSVSFFKRSKENNQFLNYWSQPICLPEVSNGKSISQIQISLLFTKCKITIAAICLAQCFLKCQTNVLKQFSCIKWFRSRWKAMSCRPLMDGSSSDET